MRLIRPYFRRYRTILIHPSQEQHQDPVSSSGVHMYHRWAALALVLALCAVPTKQAAGQDAATQPRGRKLGVLGQNYPNPFNPETHIPFKIEFEGCAGTHVV